MNVTDFKSLASFDVSPGQVRLLTIELGGRQTGRNRSDIGNVMISSLAQTPVTHMLLNMHPLCISFFLVSVICGGGEKG